uniref:Trehalase n=1 Tax=Sus scrofa TaxID=9823 RepID=A0A8D1CDY5_PIG
MQRRTWGLHLLLLLGLGLGSWEALPPPCERPGTTALQRAGPGPQLQHPPAGAAGFHPRTLPGCGAGAAALDPRGLERQPPVSAEDLGPQAASLGRAAAPAVEEAGKEGEARGPQPPRAVLSHLLGSPVHRARRTLCRVLLLMPGTVKGMLQNFLDLVQTYGHVPNGARVYYLQRSQPPLLSLMMERYVTQANDTAFLRDNLETLALELDFWTKNRSISVSSGGKSYVLNRYHVPYGGPRPESYSKDAELAATLSEGDHEALWAELKAGAESGWDFSSRWFVGGPNPDSLSSIRTSKLVPVDLNAFLCQAEELMSNFYSRLGNDSQAEKYRNLRAQRMAAMKDILWDEEKGAWFDYDLENGKKNLEFYPSNLAPLWAGCFSDPGDVDKALKYLEDSQILTYHYGIPTSLRKTGQQWDFPNAWAPLQDLVIRGLAKSPSARAQEVAFQLAQNWIRTNFDVYSRRSAMYEKYDISNGGQPGGGGEYEVQEGFGWTNGVVLMLLDRYGDRLSSGTQTVFLEPHCLTAALLLGLMLSLLPQ